MENVVYLEDLKKEWHKDDEKKCCRDLVWRRFFGLD